MLSAIRGTWYFCLREDFCFELVVVVVATAGLVSVVVDPPPLPHKNTSPPLLPHQKESCEPLIHTFLGCPGYEDGKISASTFMLPLLLQVS